MAPGGDLHPTGPREYWPLASGGACPTPVAHEARKNCLALAGATGAVCPKAQQTLRAMSPPGQRSTGCVTTIAHR
eukprot:1288503-Alexandrium_andersonii.AAC.1